MCNFSSVRYIFHPDRRLWDGVCLRVTLPVADERFARSSCFGPGLPEPVSNLIDTSRESKPLDNTHYGENI